MILANFNYEISLNDFKTLFRNSTDLINTDTMRIKRFGRNQPHVLIGEFKVLRDLGPDVVFLGYLYKRQGYEYRKTAFALNKRYCEIIETEKLFTPQLIQYIDFPVPYKCPIKAKTYNVNRFYPNITDIPPVMENGDYMVSMKFAENGKILQGIEIYFHADNLVGTNLRNNFMP